MTNNPVSTRTPSFYRSSTPPNVRLSEPALAPAASGIVILFSSLGLWAAIWWAVVSLRSALSW
jgi:hypothetical protein